MGLIKNIQALRAHDRELDGLSRADLERRKSALKEMRCSTPAEDTARTQAIRAVDKALGRKR
jgi:hypothetical protein